MKKSLLVVAGVLIAGAGLVAAGVVGTPHDLTSNGNNYYTTATDQVCVFCHTPHKGNNIGAPLWNRATDNTGFTMYDSSYSSTIDMTVDAAPTGVSLACLSCHDGTIAFDQLYNGPTSSSGNYDYDATGASRGWSFTGGNSLSGAGVTNVGKDLTDDHPISILYDNTADTAFNAPNGNGNIDYSGGGVELPLYSGKVQCGTCHNPHDNTNVPFLRASNAQSALCTSCHIK